MTGDYLKVPFFKATIQQENNVIGKTYIVLKEYGKRYHAVILAKNNGLSV
jgi:hypothetical protein